MRDTHLYEVVDTCCKTLLRASAVLSHTQILARIAAASRCVCRHIAVVHLVDNNLRRGNNGSLVLGPALGVGVVEVDDSTAVAIYVQRTCEDTRCLL